MEWHTWARWLGECAGYLIWWFGYWLALLVMSFFAAAFLLYDLLGSDNWIVLVFVTGLLSFGVVVAGWRSPSTRFLRSVAREFGGRFRTRLHDETRRSDDDATTANAVVGMIAGPFLSVLLSNAVYGLAKHLGYVAPDSGTFPFNLLLGAWLGAFTWVHLGTRLNAGTTGRWLGWSGSIALAVMASVVLLQSRQGEGAWSSARVLGALFTLSVPLAWSILHIVWGIRARRGGETGPGGSWLGYYPGYGPDDLCGGAGRPSPVRPSPPQRTAPHAEPFPDLPAAR